MTKLVLPKPGQTLFRFDLQSSRRPPLFALILKRVLRIVPCSWRASVYQACTRNQHIHTRITSRVFRLPFGLVLKTFSELPVEADALKLVESLRGIHTPYLVDYTSLDSRGFLLTTWVEGETLGHAWDRLSATDKQRVVVDLRSQFDQMRQQTISSPPRPRMICNASDGPINDPRIPWVGEENAQTFQAPPQFAEQVWIGLDWKNNRDTLKPLLQPLIDRPDVHVVFSHGDLLPKNLILPGGLTKWRSSSSLDDSTKITIIDWEFAGWMPNFWDSLKATWMECEADTEWTEMIRCIFPECAVELDADWQWRSRSRVTILA
ncbi:hypothetical protein CPB84DRAFT_1766786 [Gymnopilus junonius]|uniref:Aminoglycoside phosphotransferase domain-containing protein n=1 Tax=Gymnopilus junonius TaxID=109634 RepID=A0A9P5NY44_GYMJU|nr:hypothetical protein CPB84DRAFT_1766786 [Gymnopilus junonius]